MKIVMDDFNIEQDDLIFESEHYVGNRAIEILNLAG
jgi:hypothetical protein